MPEGPEVETIRQGLSPILNLMIVKVKLASDPKYFKGNEHEIEDLKNYEITKIERKGKFLIWTFERGESKKYALNHLGMSGVWHLYSSHKFDSFNSIFKQFKHMKVYFELSDGSHLIFICVRKFGKFIVMDIDSILSRPSIAKLGPDILEIPFNGSLFINKISRRKKEIGKALLDSSLVSGCGNIYKNEALHQAGINPFRSCNSLSEVELETLAVKLALVAQRALKLKGSTLKDFKHVNGYSGLMQNNFKVYDRKGEPCFTCNNPIEAAKQGDRTSFFCNHCQS